MQKEQLRTQNSPWYSGIHDKKPQLRRQNKQRIPNSRFANATMEIFEKPTQCMQKRHRTSGG